ncbi:stealth conserved region 3 domain-containing protein [Stackebrandtia soli]|uniref:stealth conserved region 3 domain-containing protein n=1 Tax=Stackebrandtia soli TaxID=1892856 RepID=UPI0039EB4AFC
MKITFLLTWADEMGGTELATFNLAANLADHHDVDILSVFKTQAEPFFPVDERIPVRYLIDRRTTPQRPIDDPDGLSVTDLSALAGMRSEIIDPGWEKVFNRLSDFAMTDALTGLDTNVLVTTSPALMAAAVTYAPAAVRTIHAEHRPSQLRGPTGEPLLIFGPRLDALVSLTDRTREWFAESFKAAAPVLVAIPNAAPAEYVPKSTRTSKSIVLARRLVPDKQVDHGIRAFALIKDRFPDWRLRVFGDGSQLRRLRRITEDLDATDQVEFVGSSPHMADEWAKSSICLLPSRSEAWGLVLVEAFAAGVPGIAYDVLTGPAEIIRHGVDGLLVAAGHVEGLADAMAELMSDPVRLDAMGEAALAGVERFSPERVTASWLDLLERLTTGESDAERQVAKRRRMAAQAATTGRRFATAVPAERLTPTDLSHQEREEAILATTPGLTMSGGRLAQQRDDLLANDAALENLDLVVDTLEEAGIVHCLLRDGGTQHRIAVDAADQEAVCAAFARRFAGQPVYAELVAPRGDKPGAVLAESLTSIRGAAALRMFRPVVSSSRTLRYGPAFGCDVEFWTVDDSGQFVGPTRSTSLGKSLPSLVPNARYRQGNRDYPTLKEFTEDLASDVSFPIDAVYTWVDDSDPEWLRVRSAHQDTPGDASAARFRNRDELRYSLRSVAMFAPWVRNIYIVTAGQTPDWLDADHPRITIVDHRDLFTDPSVLPTFNSHAIETQLHNIPGLSNHFLYINDDVFLARPLTPGRFFQSNGSTRFFHTPTQVPIGPVVDDDLGYFAAAKNNRALLRGKFGRVVTNGFAHAPHPLRKDVLADIAQTFATDVDRTAANRFRHNTDISMAASLHHHYGFFSGTAAPGSIRCQYIDLGNYDHHPLLTRLLSVRGYDTVCLADSDSEEVSATEQELVVRTFLNAYFPVSGPWETPSSSPKERPL